MIVRHCDGPGCHEEQDLNPGDTHPWEADQPWITVVWRTTTLNPLHFCSRICANLYTAPPMRGIDGVGGVLDADDHRDARKDVKNPGRSWDPRTDSPFPDPDEGAVST